MDVDPHNSEIRDVGVGVDLEVVDTGAGATTVLFVPGFGAGVGAYEPFLRALAAEYRVIGLSVRGFGGSAWAAPYRIGDWVEDVAGVVRSASDTPVVAIGHSFGALFALGAAAQEPSRVRAVVSLDQVIDLPAFAPRAKLLIDYWQQVRRAVVDADGDADVLAALLADALAPDRTTPVEAFREQAAIWSTQDPAVLDSLTDERFDEWLHDPTITDLPPRVQCPALCVDGDPDAGSIVSEEMAAANRAAFPQVRQMRLSGVGHGLGLDDAPARVVDAIRPFVAHIG